MDTNEEIVALAKHVIESIVDHPEEVVVKDLAGDNSLIIEVKTAKSDLGMVIGRQGRMAQAIRTILSAASQKYGKKRILFEVVDSK